MLTNNLYLIEDSEMQDIEKIKEYNEEFIKSNPNWAPFVTEDNFQDFLKEIEDKKQGIGNDGIKEIFYWFMEEGKIIGSGSIRLNPEIDEYTEKVCGHLFYQIIPSKRGNGYGTILCHLLLKEMKELGFKEALISCFDSNNSSIRIIENNGIQSICAERTAFVKALSEGEKEFESILVVGGPKGEELEECLPCGYCRQFMSEFTNEDFKIYTIDNDKIKQYKMSDILPHSFKL